MIYFKSMKSIYFRLVVIVICVPSIFFGQDLKQTKVLKTQLSPFLSKTYFNFNLGGIYYPYSNANLNPGYTSSNTKMNPFSGRFLLGYKLNEQMAVQFGVMRPASWFKYEDVEYSGQESSVWVNMWSLSFKNNFKLSAKTDWYAELGLGNLTRVGFYDDDIPIYDNAHYMTAVFGTGIQHTISDKWDFIFNLTYLPKYDKHNQPFTFQSTVGAVYNLKQVPKDIAQTYNNNTDYFFPKHFLQMGYGSGELGFFTNRFFSMQAKVGNFESLGLPVFWHGDVMAQSTFSLTYQRTAFRTERYFSLDWGASFTYFHSYNNSDVYALSLFPVLRFYLWRPKPFDFYTYYSLIGPTYISKSDIDSLGTGPKFTYQDFMGIGFFFGKSRSYNFDVRIMHYSNGNIFYNNAGVAIPLIFNLGITL